jgi:hypothetical protein
MAAVQYPIGLQQALHCLTIKHAFCCLSFLSSSTAVSKATITLTKPFPHTLAKPYSEPEPKPHTLTKPYSKPHPKSYAKPKPHSKPHTQSNTKSNPQSDSQSYSQSHPQSDSQSNTQPLPQPRPEPGKCFSQGCRRLQPDTVCLASQAVHGFTSCGSCTSCSPRNACQALAAASHVY